MADAGTVERLARFFTRALAPLKAAVTDAARFRQLWSRLGWQVTAPPPAYASLGVKVDGATVRLGALGEAPPLADVLLLAKAVADAVDEISAIGAVPAGITDPGYVAEIRQQLFDLLLTEALAASAPAWFRGLGALGVIDEPYVDATATRPAFVRRSFRWDALAAALRDPAGIPQRAFDWGTPAFRFAKFADVMSELFFAWGFPVSLERPEAGLLRAYGVDVDEVERPAHSVVVPFFNLGPLEAAFRAHVLPPAPGKLPGVAIDVTIPDPIARAFRLAEGIGLRVRGGALLDGGVAVLLRPNDVSIRFPTAPGAALPAEGLGVGFDFTRPAPAVLLGRRDGTRLEWQGASFDLVLGGGGGGGDVALVVSLKGLALVVSGDGESLFDSFLRKILGDGDTRVGVPVSLEWSGPHGIRLQGSGSFEVQVHPHLALGPVRVDAVAIRALAMLPGPPDVRLEVGATVAGSLGPLDFFVDGVGLRVDASFTRGNLGPLDLKLGFLPPRGAGLAVHAGGFTGGGFLVLDPARGRYAGGLELDFQGLVTVKAVGLLDTKMPSGRDGFSLLILISAEFVPIQLSFGFTLLGVGGLIGLNRTVVYEALRAGVHDGSLNSVLFPRDVVANAPRIVADLQRIFPPLEDHVLIGPMAKLGWGTPTMISVELGLLLEIPRPAFAILGVLRVGVPAEDAPLIKLQVNFLGVLDFGSGQLSFDASLVDSRMLTFTLSGDMAVRLYLGADANFLLTVGGFHPAYSPPPMGLPPLQRLAIDMFPALPRIRAEAYFAITSNTVQFGARVEAYAGVDLFNVYGFLALDVLVQMNPLHFVAEFSAMLAVRTGEHVIMGVQVDGLLEGPTPWHARGTGSFKIGFIIKVRLSVNFDVTVGDSRTVSLPPVDVLGQLAAAVDNLGNWRAALPAASGASVSLREIAVAADTLVVHPFGTLEITQKVVPLNLPIGRFGSQRPSSALPGGTRFRIEEVRLGTTAVPTEPTREQFAPAQFLDMSDAEKLSRRSFDRYDAGVRVGAGDRPRTDYHAGLDVGYEVTYLPGRRRGLRHWLREFVFAGLLRGGAAAQSALSFERRSPSGLGTPRITTAPEQFALASTADLSLHGADLVFESEAEARAALRAVVGRRPDLARDLQVVPLYEVNAA